MSRFIMIAALLMATTACTDEDREEIVCTAEVVPSVQLTVRDYAGDDVVDPTVTYDIGEGPVLCTANGGLYECGAEIAGDVTIRVDAPGHSSFEQTVTVVADECHVETQVLAVVLDTMECDAPSTYAVRATVLSASMNEVLQDVAVTWNYVDTDMTPQPCEQEDATNGAQEEEDQAYPSTVWDCAPGVSGDIEIFAEALNYAPESQVVWADGGSCGGQTVDVEFTLDPLTE